MYLKDEAVELAGKIIGTGYAIYPSSVAVYSDIIFFIAKDSKAKYLFILSEDMGVGAFNVEEKRNIMLDNKKYSFQKASLNYENLAILRKIFPHLNPSLCPKGKSFGTGDRLGMVSSAQMSCFEHKEIFPVLAQQSVRENTRTGRSWKNVINDAIWGYFESGSRKPFGADADHVKELEDIKKAADFSFNMFTVDPSDHIRDVSNLEKSEAEKIYSKYPDAKSLRARYSGKKIEINGNSYFFKEDELVFIAVKYLDAIKHVSILYDFLKNYKKDGFDFEVSMDEIENPVTALEHFFITTELHNLGIDFDNLALRFTGKWEKAIDYIGDLKVLESEFKEHAEIAKYFGSYKLSLHSGSEKLSTYPMFSELTGGNFHIKTAGTSYLEALRTIAEKSPNLFRKIYKFSFGCFEKDRVSYHLSTDTGNLPDIENMDDTKLINFLNWPNSRQVLHVTFGSVLTAKDDKGMGLFKDELFSKLFENEAAHYNYVSSNIEKHLDSIKY